MKERLQPFDFDKSAYERPDARWVCGRSAEGRPCREGPDGRGRCARLAALCQPAAGQSGPVCARLPELGGPCSQGPDPQGRCGLGPPCAPRRSLRSLRGLWTRGAALLVVALLVVVLASERLRSGFVAPGPMSSAHTAVASDCAACHRAAEHGWLPAALGVAPGRTDSERCLLCHDLGSAPQQAHGLPAAQLAALRAAAQQRPASEAPWDVVFARGSHGLVADRQACATCHREHQGNGHDLRTMAEERCQACHQQAFTSFEDGHPEFRQFGQMQASGIRFAHHAHLVGGTSASYFASKGEAVSQLGASCSSCHLASPDGRDVLLRGFEASCARCHDRDFETRLGDQRLVALPSFSVKGLGVGSWPFNPAAVGELPFDQTPWMRLLLAGDPAAAQLPADVLALARALHTVRCSQDPEHFSRVEADPKRVQRMLTKPCRTCKQPLRYALDAADPALQRAAWMYVRAVRRLFDDLLAAARGRLDKLRARLGHLALGALPEGTLRAWTAALPGAALQVAWRRWLPEPWYRMRMLAGPLLQSDAELDQQVAVGGWNIGGLAVSWRPRHADPLLANGLAIAGRLGIALDSEAGARLLHPLLTQLDTCAKCHTRHDQSAGFRFSWRGRTSDARERRFTGFSHAPHTDFPEHQAPSGTSCLSCHHLAPAPEGQAALSEVGLHDYHRQSICASCHTRDSDHHTGALSDTQCGGCGIRLQPGEPGFGCQSCGRTHHQACLAEGACVDCGGSLLHLSSVGARHRGPTDCLTCHSYHVGLRQTDWEVSHE